MSRRPLVRELAVPFGASMAFEAFQDRPFCFFLDSGMDPQRLGRYSFIGSDPFLVLQSRGRDVRLTTGGTERRLDADPFDVMRSLLSEYSLDRPASPVPFCGGAVGYFGYDLCHLIERLPATAADDLGLPECMFCFYDAVVVFDELEGRAHVLSAGFPEQDESRRLRRASERADELCGLVGGRRREAGNEFSGAAAGLRLRSNFSREEYLEAVRRAREYIIAGDIFQVNLSQRFDCDLVVPACELYRRLRKANPAPFACYLGFDEVVVASASPERFLRLRGDLVETRPIKGTRPRGGDAASDRALARELLSSAKDRAENIMIVDLERNDLGRVSRYGSVKVTELTALEAFPTVFHLTSTVVGRLAPGRDRVDLLRATFPGGSITGAPKVRSMEIIDELEPTRRSVYTGSIGYMGWDGGMDLNIVIRTFLVKGRRAYFQVGGGIVYDSRPEEEYQETLDKARGLVAALGLAPKMAVEVV